MYTRNDLMAMLYRYSKEVTALKGTLTFHKLRTYFINKNNNKISEIFSVLNVMSEHTKLLTYDEAYETIVELAMGEIPAHWHRYVDWEDVVRDELSNYSTIFFQGDCFYYIK